MFDDFKSRLQKALNEKRMTASELSRLCGVGKSDLSNYLNGSGVFHFSIRYTSLSSIIRRYYSPLLLTAATHQNGSPKTKKGVPPKREHSGYL